MTRRTSRRPRARAARGASRVGERIEVEVGPVAHGGHCVARVPAEAPAGDEPARDRVVFVRHALPGERVVVEVTEGSDGDSFWRADAVEVLEASPDRVPPPCPHAHPGGCGGCDFQHVAPAAQRDLKAAVVREQLSRLARIDREVEVEVVPPTLRWRTRMRYVELPDGRRGLHEHRSDRVVEIDDCLIDAGGQEPDGGDPTLETVATSYGTHQFSLAPEGFWQSHLEAPRVLVETVMRGLRPAPGERVLDLYAGVGLFAAFLSDAVGPTGKVVAVEGAREACRHAGANLGRDQVRSPTTVEHGTVERVLSTSYDEPFDLVVLDPPREGARRAVVEQIVDRAPRAVAYVACDPAALARDLATFAELGYPLRDLTAFDLFPMTHHIECVAVLERELRSPVHR
ncbi:class I SAM-dependent RNA methyltransferase [Nocardioides cynanchi]|uniref:class I SAM-dependent RNA methyltransferase n=1 Tax=Nocardioides cynanchi TaxID=2558918 RepID=UPI0012462A2D|nr:TRAM domain-containing protein [Nocardioides cynanchi]